MSSADMCQCAGCFPARQAADAFDKQMRLREKIKDLKKKSRQEVSHMNKIEDIQAAQLIAICRGAAQRCDEQHGYMELASSDPHNWLPHKWVIDAMRDLLNVNTGRIADLETTISHQKSMLESLRAELTESYAIDRDTK